LFFLLILRRCLSEDVMDYEYIDNDYGGVREKEITPAEKGSADPGLFPLKLESQK
jgi:hypothetical protein